MDLQLSGQTALITGSTAGIGFAVATGLAREGVTIVLNGRDQTRLTGARDRLLAAVPGAEVRTVAADVTTAAGGRRLLDAEPDVDILINNVAISDFATFAEVADEEWLRYFETNVLSSIRLSRHHLPRMLARGTGRMIFVSADSAVTGDADMLPYAMTKSALLTVARGLAELTRGTAVTVNSVLAGPVATEGAIDFIAKAAAEQGRSAAEVEAAYFAEYRPTSLLRRPATPEELASQVVYLSSPLAVSTNGAAVRAEGGTIRTIG
ncbi:SDR family NAD(P)-dependent oxidoreductase [Microlunatus speluncae]|uniref:SDR family NAD(P)-dependent oxidoreductase n=1 Tax=Microlunatus speluncae TaxID=2594267 RepID=UPI0012663883|nr:SDR family NAD(P)-dependent oxidoreductase [Microlunatus speluncae]